MDHDSQRRSVSPSSAAPEAQRDRFGAPVHPDAPEAPPDAIRDALGKIPELREYAAYFFSAKADAWKLTFRRLGILAAVGIAGMLAGGAIIATAGVLICIGLAQAISAALNGRAWAGNLIVGVALLALIGAGAWIMMSRITRASRTATVKKYELRRTSQRADLGQDVEQRAGGYR